MALCATCGAESSPGARFCKKCGRSLVAIDQGEQQLSAAPLNAEALTGRIGAVNLVALKRVGGRTIDWALLSIVVWQISRFVRNAEMLDSTATSMVVGVSCFLAYFGLLESRYGYTLGKRFLGLRVASKNGGLPSLSQAVIRNVLFSVLNLVGGLVELVTMFAMSGPRLGDLLAKTEVVEFDYSAPDESV